MDIINRKDAHNQGRKKFYTGEPCKNGHLAERYTTSGACTHCAQAFHKMPPGPSPELKPFQFKLAYVPTSVTAAQADALNDFMVLCVMSWVSQLGLMTDGMQRGYATLAKGNVESRKLRDHQVANAGNTQNVKTTATEIRSGIGLFLDALAVATGKDLDKMTLLARQAGEPDVAFRIRIRAETLKNTGV